MSAITAALPISYADVLAARERLAPYLRPTPLREYPLLNTLVGHDVRVWVKHENHQPTQSFKIRNGLSALTALDAEQRKRGVIGASTGNHAQAVAYAGRALGVRVAMCVPEGTSPEKLDSVRSLGAEVIETGKFYDETLAEALHICESRGLTFIHATNNPNVVAGAGTMTLEIIEQLADVDAIVVANGGGSQCVGALTVLAELAPRVKVIAVGASGAPAQYESWRQGKPLKGFPVDTMAEGIATGAAFEFTFGALHSGLSDFVSVTDDEIIAAIRDLYRITHNLAEGAGGAGLAGLRHLAPKLAGQKVAIMMCGGNLDSAVVKRVFVDGSRQTHGS